VRQLRYGFRLVLEERARLAREIHDTLAQGFIGISSQLEGVANTFADDPPRAWSYLDLARKMARHSITEARRSVDDLRASLLEGRNLETALQSWAQMWTAGSGITVNVEVTGRPSALRPEIEQNLLRITQEAVTNALKHAEATGIWIKLRRQADQIELDIVDNGRGFEACDPFCLAIGHFGLIGMRERAEHLDGELRLASRPGEGTRVEVAIPLR
jgi:signal transduction histidine kinase